MSTHARSLTLVDCIGIGINGIVGSGIYLLIARLALLAGSASVLGILACGLLCILIGLCYAELSSMLDRNGGSYLYAREAFGPAVGFGVGWMSLATGVLALAAVAVGFADALSKFVPFLNTVLLEQGSFKLPLTTLVALALIVVLGVVNYLGVKGGARTSDVLSFAKLVPLIVLAGVGLFFVRSEVVLGMFSAASVPGGVPVSYAVAISASAFQAVFMLSGFEFTAVPAGEAKNSRRNIPLAILGSLLGATLLYCAIQLVALSVLPDLHTRENQQPLMDVAGRVLGPAGVTVLGVAAVVSMAGFCASSVLVGPRYFSVLAEDGYVPGRLQGINRFGTPGAAIVVSTIITMLLALFMGFASLVDVQNVALFAQYIPTCLAVLVLRRTRPHAERSFRLPLGPVIPLAATAFSVALLVIASPKWEEWRFSGQILLMGFTIWGITVLLRRKRRPHPFTALSASAPADDTRAS